MFLALSVCMSACLSVFLCVCPSFASAYMPSNLTECPTVSLPVCLLRLSAFVSMSLSLSDYVSVSLFLCLCFSLCLSLCLSMALSNSLPFSLSFSVCLSLSPLTLGSCALGSRSVSSLVIFSDIYSAASEEKPLWGSNSTMTTSHWSEFTTKPVTVRRRSDGHGAT